jgi:hypothetical protein
MTSRWAMGTILPQTSNARASARVILTFVGSIDPDCRWTTVGDLMAVYNVASELRIRGFAVDIAWRGSLHDLSPYCVDPDAVDARCYAAMVFVCGPLHAAFAPLFAKFAQVKRIAVGVSIPPGFDPLKFVHAFLPRDSGVQITFDLALANVGYPHLSLPATARLRQVGICLVGPQGEYGDSDGHGLAAQLVNSACEDQQKIRVNTLLDHGRALPASVELDVQCSAVLVTTRMHGALLALYHGVPVVALDQIKGSAKVSRMLRAAGHPVLNAWETNRETLHDAISRRLAGDAACDPLAVRDNIIGASRRALASSIDFVTSQLG